MQQIQVTWPWSDVGVLTTWLVREGQDIKQGDDLAICFVESDSSTLASSKESSKKESTKIKGKGKMNQQRRLQAPHVGRITQLKVKQASTNIIKPGQLLAEIVDCRHPTQFCGICTTCNLDVSHLKELFSSLVTPSNPSVRFSHQVALNKQRETEERLRSERKLCLVLDLDNTVLHCASRSEMHQIPPNLAEDPEVFTFDINNIPHYIKFRPGLKLFLAQVCLLYEIYVYTMGTRSYAEQVMKLMEDIVSEGDQSLGIFGKDHLGHFRLLTRDENSTITKNLKSIFPHGDEIVVIVDDREDVWAASKDNLIHIRPYHFWQGVGDLNDPSKIFQAKNQNLMKDNGKKRLRTDVSNDLPLPKKSKIQQSSTDILDQTQSQDEHPEPKPVTIQHLRKDSPAMTSSPPPLDLGQLSALGSLKKKTKTPGSPENSTTPEASSAQQTSPMDIVPEPTPVVHKETGMEAEKEVESQVDTGSGGTVLDNIVVSQVQISQMDTGSGDTVDIVVSHGQISQMNTGSGDTVLDAMAVSQGPISQMDAGSGDTVLDNIVVSHDQISQMNTGSGDTVLDNVVVSQGPISQPDTTMAVSQDPILQPDTTMADTAMAVSQDPILQPDTAIAVSQGPISQPDTTMADKDISEPQLVETEPKDERSVALTTITTIPPDNTSSTTTADTNSNDGGEPKDGEDTPKLLPVKQENDQFLNSVLRVLQDVHLAFFNRIDRGKSADVKKCLQVVRRRTLHNCHILFSGLFRTDIQPSTAKEWINAERCGAYCHKSRDPDVTHLVAVQGGTEKIKEALKAKADVYIVNPEWLLDSIDHWCRQDESKYPVMDKTSTPPVAIPTLAGRAPTIVSVSADHTELESSDSGSEEEREAPVPTTKEQVEEPRQSNADNSDSEDSALAKELENLEDERSDSDRGGSSDNAGAEGMDFDEADLEGDDDSWDGGNGYN